MERMKNPNNPKTTNNTAHSINPHFKNPRKESDAYKNDIWTRSD